MDRSHRAGVYPQPPCTKPDEDICMTRLFRISAVALLVLTLLPACSLLKKKDAEATGPIEPAQITVHNRNVLDVNIIAYRGTERIRLGTITSGNSEVFVLDERIIVNSPVIRFIADPIGSARNILIEELTVFPGDQIELWVPIRKL